MSALAREDVTVADALRSRLWTWGDCVTHGWLPGQGDGIRSGNKPGSTPPMPTWIGDISVAFAKLNPLTYGLGADGNFAWLAHVPHNRDQAIIWAYYAEGLGHKIATELVVPEAMIASSIRRIRPKVHVPQRVGDKRVAERLHLSDERVRKLRYKAIDFMARRIIWEEYLPVDDDPGIE